MGRLAGKTVFVTGAASSLGEGTARLLAAEGTRVFIAGLKVEWGEAVARETGDQCVKLDVAQEGVF